MKKLTNVVLIVIFVLIIAPGLSAAKEETVIIREGFTVPDGKRLLIDDITVMCNLLIPTFFNWPNPAVQMLSGSSTPILRITYPNDKCPENITGEDEPHCPFQDHSLGVGSNYSAIAQHPDGRNAISIYAGRQTSIIADEGAILYGLCPVNRADVLVGAELISVGIGRLIKMP